MGSPVARVRQDKAGGLISSPGAPSVKVNGTPISTVGDTVMPHGNSPHTKAVIKTGSGTVKAEGKRVARKGKSVASCGHNVSTGSPNVKVD